MRNELITKYCVYSHTFINKRCLNRFLLSFDLFSHFTISQKFEKQFLNFFCFVFQKTKNTNAEMSQECQSEKETSKEHADNGGQEGSLPLTAMDDVPIVTLTGGKRLWCGFDHIAIIYIFAFITVCTLSSLMVSIEFSFFTFFALSSLLLIPLALDRRSQIFSSSYL